MKDWKAALTGFLGIVAVIGGHFGFDLPSEVQVSILSVTVFIANLFHTQASQENKEGIANNKAEIKATEKAVDKITP